MTCCWRNVDRSRRMIRLLAMLLVCAVPAVAQEPILRYEIDESEAIPGQAVSLRLTVLVPTFLPAPPSWPSYEAPNLLVRVGFTGPVSERIDGATWSGVSRRYLIAPMVPGRVSLPAQEISVTWADPETSAPRRSSLSTEPLTITAIVPDGAEGLEPFVAAEALTLQQSVEGTPERMEPGDSVIRTVTATIEGTSPMFLPSLLPPHAIAGLRVYPDSPIFEESTERDAVRGTRIERVTLVAEGGGSGAAPAVTLDWYNLRTGTVETAKLPAIAVSVDGPPVATAAPAARDWRAIGLSALAGLAALALLVAAVRRLTSPVTSWLRRRHTHWLASEARAWQALRHAVTARDHGALRTALETWALRVRGPDPRRDPRLSVALTTLGAARYGRGRSGEGAGWKAVSRTLTDLRNEARRKPETVTLPPLNPRN